jgi:hypothetical protein
LDDDAVRRHRRLHREGEAGIARSLRRDEILELGGVEMSDERRGM